MIVIIPKNLKKHYYKTPRKEREKDETSFSQLQILTICLFYFVSYFKEELTIVTIPNQTHPFWPLKNVIIVRMYRLQSLQCRQQYLKFSEISHLSRTFPNRRFLNPIGCPNNRYPTYYKERTLLMAHKLLESFIHMII